jgi:RNA polymerase sigma-70 factor (ECF subfamily)
MGLDFGMTSAISASMPGDPEAEISELMHRVANSRDRAAFQSLFLYFGPRVKGLMIKSGAEPDLAEDIAQEAMITVWRKAPLYSQEKGKVATWVFTIARNLRIDHLRRQSSRPYEDVEELDLPSQDAGGEETVIGRQRDERVSLALGQLQSEQRRVIELSFVEDMPQSEIAKKLNLPLGTVKSRMRLAYGKLREKLEDLK